MLLVQLVAWWLGHHCLIIALETHTYLCIEHCASILFKYCFCQKHYVILPRPHEQEMHTKFCVNLKMCVHGMKTRNALVWNLQNCFVLHFLLLHVKSHQNMNLRLVPTWILITWLRFAKHCHGLSLHTECLLFLVVRFIWFDLICLTYLDFDFSLTSLFCLLVRFAFLDYLASALWCGSLVWRRQTAVWFRNPTRIWCCFLLI